jgi:CheY-specific phosphatase CheX
MGIYDYINALKVKLTLEKEGVTFDNMKVMFGLIGEEVNEENVLSVIHNSEYRDMWTKDAITKIDKIIEDMIGELSGTDTSNITTVLENKGKYLDVAKSLYTNNSGDKLSLQTAKVIKSLTTEEIYDITFYSNVLSRHINRGELYTEQTMRRLVSIVEADIDRVGDAFAMIDMPIRDVDIESDSIINNTDVVKLGLATEKIIEFLSVNDMTKALGVIFDETSSKDIAKQIIILEHIKGGYDIIKQTKMLDTVMGLLIKLA